MADPLGGNGPSAYPAHDGSPNRSLQPSNDPSSPYRAQPLPPPPTTSAWGSPPTSPQQQQSQQGGGGWTGAGEPHAGSSFRPQGGMEPRSPQAYDRRRAEGLSDDESGAPRNGGQAEGPPVRAEPSVRVRVIGLDKNRRDFYIKFNAESNLATFRNSVYRSVSRSYTEFQRFADAVAATCPQSIIPALPLAETSAATHDEDDRLVRIGFQKWLNRLTADAAVMRDDELRNFIESDFGYTPSSKAKRRMPSTFYFPKGGKLPGEQDDDLTVAKSSMSRLEAGLVETAKAIEKVAKARRQVAIATVDVGDKLASFALTETYAPLAGGINKLARTTKINADIWAGQATAEQVTLGDSLAYQAANARCAKETLLSRDVIVDEHRTAAKSTIAKRKAIEKLKTQSNIKADRVDEALDELDEAKKHETLLNQRLAAISTNLQPSLRAHQKLVNEDILAALLEHARVNLQHEKSSLRELEALRPQLANIQRPTAGVIYHNSPTTDGQRGAAGGMTGSPSMTRQRSNASAPGSPIQARPGLDGRANSHQSAQSGFSGHKSLDDPLNGPRTLPTKRSVRSMAQSVIVEGDRRQRVDDRMAASLLANGF